MKKNYIYILIFIFGLFSFSSDVLAAQELTCLYKKQAFKDKVLLIQYKDGKRKIFKNENDVGIQDGGWYPSKAYTDRFGTDLRKKILDKNGNLIECPPAKDTSFDGAIFWYDNNMWTGITTAKLIEDYKKVVEPGITVSGEVENDNLDEGIKGKSCEKISDYSNLWPDGLGKDALGTSKKGTKFTGACLYAKTIYISSNEVGCHLIQVNFNKEDVEIIEYDPVKGEEYSSDENFAIKGLQGTFKYDSGYTGKAILDNSNGVGSCISPIRVKRYVDVEKTFNKINTNVYLTGSKGEGYSNVDAKGKTSGTGTKLDVGFSMNVGFEDIEDIKDCEDLFGEEIVGMFKSVWNFVRILVPIILIVLGTLDFSKAVFSGNEDGMKKAQSKFIKRIIIAVAIFVIPSVLSLLLNIANSVFGDFGTDICGILG